MPPDDDPRPEALPTVRCYSCGGRFSVGVDAREHVTVYHSLPFCAAFDALEGLSDALDFITRCRKAFDPS